MLQNNTSGKAKNATILHKYGHILFAVISRHEPITLSVPPTFQGNLRKQRILQQSSRIINLPCGILQSLFVLKTSQIKENGKIIRCFTLSTNGQLIYSLAD